MKHHIFKILFILISIGMVLILSLFSTIPVFADDTTPPMPTEEPAEPLLHGDRQQQKWNFTVPTGHSS